MVLKFHFTDITDNIPSMKIGGIFISILRRNVHESNAKSANGG